MFPSRPLLKSVHKPTPKKYGISVREQAKQLKQLGFTTCKRAAFGLFGNKETRFSQYLSKKTQSSVSHTVLPNLRESTLFSHAMNASIDFKVTTKVLRCIDKKGGLDGYLLTTNHKLGPRALATKNMIAEKVQELKAQGQYQPFPGVPDSPQFPKTIQQQIQLDIFVRAAEQRAKERRAAQFTPTPEETKTEWSVTP